MSELKACPFCGGAAVVRGDEREGFFATCAEVDCFCCVGEAYDRDAWPEHMFRTEDEAVAAWNRRAPVPVALDNIATINDVADRIALHAPHHAAKDYQAAARDLLAPLREKGVVE